MTEGKPPLLIRAHGRTYVDRATVTYALEHILEAADPDELVHPRVLDLIDTIDTEKGYE